MLFEDLASIPVWMAKANNVSYVNERYQPAYGIKSIDYDEETRTFNFENKD